MFADECFAFHDVKNNKGTNKQQNQNLLFIRLSNTIKPAVILLSCFTLSFVAASLVIHPQSTKAVDGLSLVSAPSLSLASSTSTLNITVTPTAAGTLASSSHNLITNTNVHTGFSLSIATPTPPTLPPTTGTLHTPTVLANNTWGYAIPGTGGFDGAYTSPTPAATSKWANPSTSETIKTVNSAATNDITTIYYGAKANIGLASGTYANTVQYTATAHLNDIPAPTITSITPNAGTTAGGTSITIVGSGFTINDQSVTTAVTIGGVACENVSISSKTPISTQDTIYCNIPIHPTAESVAVSITTWHSTVTAANGYTYAAPTPTITAPTANQIFNSGTTSTNLNVTTNFPAICYYGTAANPTTQMTTTSGTTHSVSLTGLVNQSTNTRHVRCQAASGHSYGTTASVTFYIRAVTPAAPTLSPANGQLVDIGITHITVTSTNAACTWGTSNNSATDNASGTIRVTTSGINTLYYSCITGTGNTASVARTGYWSYIGITPIQIINDASCTTTRKLTYDARDNRTYWIQKLSDGKCWMLTNLAYGGGGTNDYGDVKDITNSNTLDYSKPYYMVHANANPTTRPTLPSTSTSGVGQYGYHYNWCAAMGAQAGTAACGGISTPLANPNISICPRGWRLPTGGDNSEFTALNNAINSGSATSDAGLKNTWLGMYNGKWFAGFDDQDAYGLYWSSTQNTSQPTVYAHRLGFGSNFVNQAGNSDGKRFGLAVRCILNEPTKTGEHIQNVTIDTCPSSRTRVVDARDNRTYWIQRLSDGKCWMLTNLAYGGGGTNTYGDVKSITNSNTDNFSRPQYMIPPGANATSGTTDPSTSTTGIGQYGYLYNWCAAMGSQTSTAACSTSSSPAPNTNISICPRGWRLPTSGAGGDYQTLNRIINGNSTTTDSGLRSIWLGMYGGGYNTGFYTQNKGGYYWSSTQDTSNPASYSHYMQFHSTAVIPSGSYVKSGGLSVRCLVD